MTIARRAAIGAAILFSVIAAFQLALAIGAPWGEAAYGGAAGANPAIEFRATSVVSFLIWSAAALVVLKRVGFPVWAPLPRRVLPVIVWVLAGILVLATLLNGITPSALERAIWLPISAVTAATVAVVAIASRRAERAAR